MGYGLSMLARRVFTFVYEATADKCGWDVADGHRSGAARDEAAENCVAGKVLSPFPSEKMS